MRAADTLKSRIKDEVEEVVNRAPDYMKLRELMGEVLNRTDSDGPVSRLRGRATEVQESARQLAEKLQTVLPDLSLLLQECNVLMTGVGPRNEYLLDMCSQTSTMCIDD